MSALPAPVGAPEYRSTPLRAVPNKPRQIAQLPFVLIIAVLLGVGMTGVLVLSTTIQTKSSELSALQTREADLRHQEAALVAQVQDLRSSQKLAERAWEVGMRPNPHPAFIQMPSGQVVGVPAPVSGDELAGMAPPRAVAAARAAAEQAAKAASEQAARAAAEQAAAQAARLEAEDAAASAAADAPGGTSAQTGTQAQPEQQASVAP